MSIMVYEIVASEGIYLKEGSLVVLESEYFNENSSNIFRRLQRQRFAYLIDVACSQAGFTAIGVCL